jgi:type IV pilus assembly protein PilM
MLFGSKNSFGLDISDTSLKLVWLDSQGNLRAWNEIEVPVGLIEKGVIKDKNKVVKIIQKLLATAHGKKIRTKKVIACLPETKTFIKIIEIPATLENKKVNNFILDGIQQYFPVKAEEIYIDWQSVGPEEVEDDLIKVMVGVAPRQIVDDYLEVLASAGLQIEALQIEAGAIVNALIRQKKEKAAEDDPPKMILDLGANRSSIILYDKGVIQFSISIPVSGSGITEEIAASLKMSEAEAEDRKIKVGLEDEKSKEYKIIEKNFSVIVKEIKQAQRFEGWRDSEEVEELIICGGAAKTKKLPEYLAAKTNLKITLGDPFVNIKPGKKQRVKLPGAPIAFMTAIGLALAGIKAD